MQAVARCHRTGQTRPVVVYQLIMANTIEVCLVSPAFHTPPNPRTHPSHNSPCHSAPSSPALPLTRMISLPHCSFLM